MDVRAGRRFHVLKRRQARGKRRLGMKVGKRKIRMMNSSEIDQLIQRSRSNTIAKSLSRSARKQFKKIKRLISLMRSEGLPRFFSFREDNLLDNLHPTRAKDWLEYNERKKDARIDLRYFSFLEDPLKTIENLRQIIAAEVQSKRCIINFLDDYCLDLGPYMVLGLARQSMADVFIGGSINGPIADAIHAVNLKQHLRIGKMGHPHQMIVHPFKLRSRRNEGKSTNDNLPEAQTTEEKTCQDFVETLNGWLENHPQPMKLSSNGEKNIAYLLGEILVVGQFDNL